MAIPAKKIEFTPAQVTMLSFCLISLVGTLLLMTPYTHTNGEWLDWVSAFFMSVSATCVTGLAVVDLGKDFTLWGQLVILILMQVGGLSYMTITTILIYMTGKRLSFSDTKVFDMSNNSESKINFADFVIKIGLLTLTIEGIGFLFLMKDSMDVVGVQSWNDYELIGIAAFQALFHAVSAFCNAGLSLYTGSLEGFRDNFWMLWMFSILPILGGLGYTVLNELSVYYTNYMKAPKRAKPRFEPSLHTRVSLVITALLLVFGVLIQLYLIYAQDINAIISNGLQGFAQFWDMLWVSFFQTCAARSSGFNSIPLNDLGDPSLILLIVYMFIGACPGGTGGGIKVTTLAVVFAIIWAGLREHKNVRIFNRCVNPTYQKRALIVFISTSVMIIGFTWMLTIFESAKGIRFIEHLFEVTSAFTTVGLSTGITGDLSDPSLIVLAICMIIGRPGPLLFLMALVTEETTSRPNFPEEGILIG